MFDDNSGDSSLVERWRTGDSVAGELLFERYFDSLYGFFETKCPDEADELVQATFLGCLRGRETFRHDASFRTYLFTIARNQLYTFLRDRHRDRVIEFGLSSIEDLHTTPGTRLTRRQEHTRVVAALRRLPLEQQTLLELHYVQDMAIAELSEVFDAPPVTIRSRLHRARRQLRDILERDPALARSVLAREEQCA
jgi:RNA polymerase sigma-70 factor (ECF subfamily)